MRAIGVTDLTVRLELELAIELTKPPIRQMNVNQGVRPWRRLRKIQRTFHYTIRKIGSVSMNIRGAPGDQHIDIGHGGYCYQRIADDVRKDQRDDSPDMLGQGEVPQLQRSNIERQEDAHTEERDRLKCFLQNLAADLSDRAIPLGHRNEDFRGDHAENRVLPRASTSKP